jgi:hypothetical protein
VEKVRFATRLHEHLCGFMASELHLAVFTGPQVHGHGLAPVLVAQNALNDFMDVHLRVPLITGAQVKVDFRAVFTLDLDVVG